MNNPKFESQGIEYVVISGILYQRSNGCLTEPNQVPAILARQASKYGYSGPVSAKIEHFHSHAKQARREAITA